MTKDLISIPSELIRKRSLFQSFIFNLQSPYRALIRDIEKPLLHWTEKFPSYLFFECLVSTYARKCFEIPRKPVKISNLVPSMKKGF